MDLINLNRGTFQKLQEENGQSRNVQQQDKVTSGLFALINNITRIQHSNIIQICVVMFTKVLDTVILISPLYFSP